jgi:hypothetical protein
MKANFINLFGSHFKVQHLPLQRLLSTCKMSNKIVISFSSKPTANLFYRLKWRGITTLLTTNHLDFEVKIHQL